MKIKLGRYPIECIIYEKRGENIVYSRDVAGRFNDPVNSYKLKKNKDSIPIPQYDWVLQNMARPTNIFEKISSVLSGKAGTITLFKYGSKQYKPIKVKIGNKVKVKFKQILNKKGEPIYVTVYEPLNVKREMSRLDFEVIDWDDINHMTQELRAIAVRRSPLKSFLERWGGHIALAIGFLALVVGGYYFKEILFAAGDKYTSTIAGGSPQPPPEPPASGGNTPFDSFIPGA